MERPEFSVIVVCYNAGVKLRETVESVLSQTCPDYEIIVKDGLSDDGSTDRLPEDGRIRLIRRADRGIYDAMNQAVREASGQLLYFLNCGDLFYDREVLARVLSFRQTLGDGEAVVIYGDIHEELTGQTVKANPHIDEFACYRNVPCHQACFYDRRLFDKGGFEPRYAVRADYEHFLRCFFQEKARMAYLPVTVARYEGGGFSETRENRKRSAEEHREIVGRYMKKSHILRYRLILLLTLAPLRTRLSQDRRTAEAYNRLKKRIYGLLFRRH